ncbi:hypothetical protein MM5_157 [Morganella phage vB_Mm5]
MKYDLYSLLRLENWQLEYLFSYCVAKLVPDHYNITFMTDEYGIPVVVKSDEDSTVLYGTCTKEDAIAHNKLHTKNIDIFDIIDRYGISVISSTDKTSWTVKHDLNSVTTSSLHRGVMIVYILSKIQ